MILGDKLLISEVILSQSTLLITHLCSSKNVLRLAYQTRDAYISPYKYFKSLYTLWGYLGFSKSGGCIT
jgi:hypothetical protein